MKKVLVAAAAVLLGGAPAMAQPTISGNYIVTITKLCQLTETYNFNAGDNIGDYVNAINSSGSNFKQSMMLATFSPAKGKVTIDGIDDGGDLTIIQFTGAQSGQLGTALAQTPNSGKSTYANTDTTFTISGQTFDALYGQINKKGVAEYITFQGVWVNQSGQTCTEQGIAQAQ